jgi:hypothetical protein
MIIWHSDRITKEEMTTRKNMTCDQLWDNIHPFHYWVSLLRSLLSSSTDNVFASFVSATARTMTSLELICNFFYISWLGSILVLFLQSWIHLSFFNPCLISLNGFFYISVHWKGTFLLVNSCKGWLMSTTFLMNFL